ncbi:MAG: hypothetical protein ACYCO9_00335 [Streptosporangiaceae bacterium]
MRPVWQVVRRARGGQSRPATPTVAIRVRLSATVCPAGQVTVPACSSAGEVTDGEPVGHRGLQRLGLDHRVIARVIDRTAQVPGAAGGDAVPGQAVFSRGLAMIRLAVPLGISPPAVLPARHGASGPPGPAATNSSATAGSEFSVP